jgi:hypothetical protein
MSVNFITSPFLYFQLEGDTFLINVLTNDHYKEISSEMVDVLFFFLSTNTVEAAITSDINEGAIKVAIDLQFIIDVNSNNYRSMGLWEIYNWGRAAFLTFSQQNLKYSETIKENTKQSDLISQRRSLMSKYVSQSPYPSRYIPKSSLSNIEIPISKKQDVDLNVMKSRSCSRSFKEDNITFEQFSNTITQATEDIRIAESSRWTGDNFFLLNSYYTWAVIYVVIQGVEGIKNGLYYYDPQKSTLMLLSENIDNVQLSDCIQGQSWIGGGGFSLLIGAQWERYSWLYRHSRAYINLLIQLGELSQDFLSVSYKKGLSGWMTPAVTEVKANILCQIPKAENIDIIYFMKFGIKK